MAVISKVYGQATLNAFKGKVSDLSSTGSDIRVALLTTSYSPDQDNHENYGQLTGEVVGTNYIAGGAALTNKAITYDGITNVIKFDADDVEWSNSTITARYAVIYDNTPTLPADKKLVAYVDFGENKISSEGSFKIFWHTDGIFKTTIA